MRALAWWLALCAATVCLTVIVEKAVAVPYRLDATSSFDPYAGETAWIKAHVHLIHGYGTFAKEHYVNKGFPTIDYHDAATEGYAPLTPANRTRYMAKVEADKAQGFVGVANDDVNLTVSFRDGNQNKSSYEPEAHELCELIKQERVFWPKGIIETNTQWHDLDQHLTDANGECVWRESSSITKEFGLGPTAGITTKTDYENLRHFDQQLQNLGKWIVYNGDSQATGTAEVEAMEYTLATTLLDFRGLDEYSTAKKWELPPTWWPGSDVNLGEPFSGEPKLCDWPVHPGLCLRWFTHGVAYMLQPQASPITINLLPGFCSVEWGCPVTLTLHERQGAVFVGSPL